MTITSFDQTVRDIVKFLKTDEVLAAVPGIEFHIEDKSDITSEVTKFLKGFGVMVVISVVGYDRRINSGNLMTGSLKLNISAIENTRHNRNNPGFMTATDVSVRIAEILHFKDFDLLSSPIRFTSMQRADVERESAIMNASYVAESQLFTLEDLPQDNINETTQEGE